MIIGLTGAYCSGKNHIASMLEKRGLPVLDVDKLGHKAIEMEKDRIIALFGNSFGEIHNENHLDRRLLGKIVYGNPEKLAALEAIVHPVANRLTEEWVNAQKSHCVINAALLHRTTLIDRIERIILVKAPFFTRLMRAKRRDSLSFGEIWRRISSQKDFYAQYLSLNAEIYIVENPQRCGGFSERKPERRIDAFLGGIK
ncbi:MAG: dephospho-CoA kinase [Treponema sp.]|nr:dephospho-CoA kinase [Treponema sp.]